MGTVVLLLRGINVGGRNRLPMADLRAIVGTLGLEEVRTHLQSGNVVAAGPGSPPALAADLAAALLAELTLTVPVVGRSGQEWSALRSANPFVGDEDDPTRLHVTFLDGEPEPGRVAALASRVDGSRVGGSLVDRCAVVGADVFLHLAGGYADTPFQNAVLEKQLGRVATTRNWRTVLALSDLVASTGLGGSAA